MFSICKNFIKVNESLFVVKKTYAEERIVNIDAAKELFGVSHVFKNNGVLYFTEEVPDLEIITE